MFALLRRHLVFKLGLLTLATVATGFLGWAVHSVRRQQAAMRGQYFDTAMLFARGLASGVRNSMLTGDPLATRQFLASVEAGIGSARVRVFAPQGDEVFAPPPPPPPLASLPAPLAQVITTGQVARAGNGALLEPIVHEARCTRCHDPPGTLRGVLELGLVGATRPASTDAAAREVVATAVTHGFVQIMTARRTDAMGDFFAEIKAHAPAVLSIAVYNARGAATLGDDAIEDTEPAVTPEAVRAVVEANRPRLLPSGPHTVEIIPLANEVRCNNCHRASDRMRGAVVVALRPELVPLAETLSQVSEVAVRHIMVSGLGRLTAGYLDAVAATGAVGTLVLYDPHGRVYHDALAHPAPPDWIAQVLAGRTRQVDRMVTAGGAHSFVFATAMPNDADCQRCHGADRPVRGAIEVVLDASREVAQRRQVTREAVWYGVGTALVVLLALALGLTVFVITPVAKLSDVADRIGMGHLDMLAPAGSSDEVGRLGARLNQMIAGLRERLHLSKFVSQGTLAAVATGAVGMAAIRLGGERRHVTVLFSDIRGFTAYSEVHEPEEVVAMLNAYLNKQTEVVHRNGGDVDKFVGDELMALFFGADAEVRAARCGVEMIEAVTELQRQQPVDAVAIGVGINTGEAIIGAMGAADRMDHTAIGDTVNLGARLCSNAARGQVLVSEAVRKRLEGVAELEAVALEPIRVKGKAQPVAVFDVRRAWAPAPAPAAPAPAPSKAE